MFQRPGRLWPRGRVQAYSPSYDGRNVVLLCIYAFVTLSSWSCHDEEGWLWRVAAFVEEGGGTATRGAFNDRDLLGAVLRRRDAQHDGARGEGRRPGLPGQERGRIQGNERNERLRFF